MVSQRILFVIDSLRVGGAETLLLDLLDAAKTRGDLAHVAYFTPGPLAPEVEKRGIATTRLSARGLKDPRALFRAWQLMRRWKPDVVHSHLTKSDLVAQMTARMLRLPRLLTLHNAAPWRKKRLPARLYHWVVGNPDALIAVTPLVADHVARYGGVPRDDIEVIQNGVDLARFSPDTAIPLDLTQFGVPKDAVVIAKVGRLNVQKDHANFLRAAAILARKDPRAHFLVVGDGELMEQSRELAKQLGLGADRLTFTGNIRQMPELLAAIDIFMLASAWEGLPMVLLEAMAMGLPVVSTAVGGVPDLIENGENGMLVPASDPAALAAAGQLLVSDAEMRSRIGAAGQDTVRARFSGQAMTDRIWSLYAAARAGALKGQPQTMEGKQEWNG